MKTRVILYYDGRTTYCRIQYFRPELDLRDVNGCGPWYFAAWCSWPDNQYRQYDSIATACEVAHAVANGNVVATETVVTEFGD